MCGIVGVCGLHAEITEPMLRRMCDAIEHRGPDDDGYFVAEQVGLGMRRLSIIDPAGGKQPIMNEDESCVIVFNGEIYNHRELMSELRERGHRFSTRSDTEAILHRFEEVGASCADSLNGMFAFAIWNQDKRELVISRDRMGIKPLYYHWDGSTLVFASEIKAILASGIVETEVSEEGLWEYLTFRYVPAPLTIWDRIHKLPPAHTLTFSPGGEPTVTRYWDINFIDRGDVSSEAVDQKEFDALLLDSVERILIADVPVGILLSGGLDSSAVAAAVAEVHNAPLATFSVAFEDGGEFSELGYARQVAEHFGTDHHEVVIDLDDFIDFLPELPWYTDEPLADPASVPLFYVSRLAGQHVKVVLSGEGADEVIGGYNFDQTVAGWDRVERLQKIPSVLRDLIPRTIFSALGRQDQLDRLTRLNLPMATRNQTLLPQMTYYLTGSQKRELAPQLARFKDSESVIAGYYRRARTNDPLHQVLYAFCQDWLVEDLLMKADKMTMANSLELRVPFLDHRLVEWLAAHSSQLKVMRGESGGYTTKYLLRRFAESRLPASIIKRPKQGFPVPLSPWMHGRLGEFAREVVLGSASTSREWFRNDVLEGYVDRGMSKGVDEAHRLWLLLVLELWARKWMGSARPAEMVQTAVVAGG